jgi:hypothetical protein
LQDASNGDVPHGIQALAVGALTFPASRAEAGPIAPLVNAGEIPGHISSFEVVEVGGKKALKYVTVANWGPGFDLDNSAFAYAEGDTITIKGTAAGTSVNLALNKNQGSTQTIVGNRITAAGDFTIAATLTAADISMIQTNELKTIRFEDRAGGTTVTITQILIEGERPSSALATPAVTLTGSVLSWGAVTGATNYIVSANNSVISTQTGLSIDLLYALNGKADGSYSVTVVATGTGIRDSAASAAVNYAFTNYSVPISVKIDGVDVATEVKMIGTSVRFESGAANAFKVTAGQSSTSYPVVVIDLSALTTPKKLSDVSSIEFLAEHISGAGANGKQFQVLAAKNAAAPTGFKAITRKSADKWTVASGATVAASPEQPDLPVFEALVNDAGFKNEDKLVLFFNPDNPAATVVYEIGPIEITTGGNAPNEVIDNTTNTSLLNIKLDEPVTGVAPKTTITQNDAAGNLAFTGTVIWNPPAGSAFAMFETYTASIILTPAITYRFAQPADAFTPVPDQHFTVNGDPAGVADFIESFGKVGFSYTFERTVNFPEEFDIDIQGATGATEKVKYADVAIKFGNNVIAPVANGYATSIGNNYDWSLVAFKINLGDKTLADFKEVTLYFTGISGDFGYKRVCLLAGKVGATQANGGLPTTGGFYDNSSDTAKNYQIHGNLNGAGSARTNQTGNIAGAAGVGVPQKITFEIDPDLFTGRLEGIGEESELEIAFHIQQGQTTGTAYSIADITFVAAD